MGHDDEMDKEWARKYLLDPLTAPEPSQETGPGTSHVHPLRNSTFPSHSQSVKGKTREDSFRPRHASIGEEGAKATSTDKRPPRPSYHRYPTPPSGSPPGNRPSSFHPSNPFASPAQRSPTLDTHAEEILTPPGSPPILTPSPRDEAHPTRRRPSPQNSSQHPPSSLHGRPPHHQHRRGSSVQTPGPPPYWSDSNPRRHRSFGANTGNVSGPKLAQNGPPDTTTGVNRRRSLNERYPGDMSHRPLDMITKDIRAADRNLRRKRLSDADTIDRLDTVGGGYHHGGPYDATLASRNTNPIYSPVAAVRESNEAALRATPREYLQDSLRHHVPLQGTATIPAGQEDLGGNIMDYEEGTDLKQGWDAPGGLYKGWEDIEHLPAEFKGKVKDGKYDPNDRYVKSKHRRQQHSESHMYEMQSLLNGYDPVDEDDKARSANARVRSVSNVGEGSSRAMASANAYGGGENVHRSSSTGKKLSEGLKRRLGSLRRKKDMPAAEVH